MSEVYCAMCGGKFDSWFHGQGMICDRCSEIASRMGQQIADDIDQQILTKLLDLRSERKTILSLDQLLQETYTTKPHRYRGVLAIGGVDAFTCFRSGDLFEVQSPIVPNAAVALMEWFRNDGSHPQGWKVDWKLINCIGGIEKIERDLSLVLIRTDLDFLDLDREPSLWVEMKCILPQCECGGDKAKTTHSDWCPKYAANS